LSSSLSNPIVFIKTSDPIGNPIGILGSVLNKGHERDPSLPEKKPEVRWKIKRAKRQLKLVFQMDKYSDQRQAFDENYSLMRLLLGPSKNTTK